MAVHPLTPERRRQQTRDHLVQAAAQVFAERGFHGASLDQVAAVAGFTKGAVYSNFSSKDDLFLAVLESRFEDELAVLHATIAAAGDEDLRAHLSDFVTHIRDQFDTSNPWGLLHLEFCAYAVRNPEARAKLARFERADIDAVAAIIDDQRARHGIPSDGSSEHEARIVVGLIRGLSILRLLDETIVDEPLLESTVAFLGRAMLPDPPGVPGADLGD